MKKYKQEISTTLKAIFSLIIVIFIYNDIVDLVIALEKKEILVYLLLTKWLLILIILYILFTNIKSIFKATITKANEELKIDKEIIKSSNRPTQTEEVIENIKNNISDNEIKQSHSKDDILKQEKLNSLGDNILKKYKKD
jgi:hypothetical protein